MCCKVCKQDKNVSDFYTRKRHRAGELYTTCKECMKRRGRTYYHENKVRQLKLARARNTRYRRERREFLHKLKNKPCADCGNVFPPYVMDFHHVEPETKEASVATLIHANVATTERITAEVAKCILLCANCHRIRTHSSACLPGRGVMAAHSALNR